MNAQKKKKKGILLMLYLDRWYKCPICGQKILKISKEAQSKGLYIKCKKCKNEIEIKIEPREPVKS